jgi:hypothetical protein
VAHLPGKQQTLQRMRRKPQIGRKISVKISDKGVLAKYSKKCLK